MRRSPGNAEYGWHRYETVFAYKPAPADGFHPIIYKREPSGGFTYRERVKQPCTNVLCHQGRVVDMSAVKRTPEGKIAVKICVVCGGDSFVEV